MSDQFWAVVIGGVVMLAVRVLDFYLPKGRISKWAKEHSVKDDTDPDDEE